MKARLCSLVLLMAVMLTATAPASAQSTLAIREKVYEKLSRAQEAAEAEDWEEAFDKLREVERMRDLDAHEKAQLYTAWGYTYFARQEYRQSIESFETVLQQEDLPEALRTSTSYTLAQLWFQEEDYEKAAGHLEAWLAVTENPGPEALVLLGQAYYQLGRLTDAVDPVRHAIDIAEQRNQAPRENWYALLHVFYHELQDHDRLLEVLEILVTRWPSRDHWRYLASTYGEMGDTDRQLATCEAAYIQGYLTSGGERLLYSQLLLQAGLPHRAAVILDEALASGLVDGTAQNWRLLSQAWSLAHEHPRAITALSEAAALSNDGELDARIAQSHALLDEWDATIAAARVALRKGVDNEHELHIMIGMAYFELEDFVEARSAFETARMSPDGRRVASQWITYIDRERARLREMERSLN